MLVDPWAAAVRREFRSRGCSRGTKIPAVDAVVPVVRDAGPCQDYTEAWAVAVLRG